MSRPARARGLKLKAIDSGKWASGVAPRAGAWIETEDQTAKIDESMSRPARARGLKPQDALSTSSQQKSRPARARGLKLA